MAARENQGYLIAVIVLILLLLVSTLVAFLGWNRAAENFDSQLAADNKLILESARAEGYETLTNVMAAYIGKLGETTSEVETNLNSLSILPNKVRDEAGKSQIDEIIKRANDIKAQFESDMKLMISTGADEQEQEQSWRALVDSYAAALGKIHDQNNTLQLEMTRVNDSTRKALEAKDKVVEQTQAALQSAQNDLATEKQARQTDVAKLNSSLDAIRQENKTLGDNFDTFRRDAIEKQKSLSDQVAAITKERDSIKEKYDYITKENFELADGRVIRVSPELGTVVLNVGTDDGLRPNQSFSIYEQTAKNFEKNSPKASVEVTKITGPHQAEARITQEDSLNPILANDQILAPAWDPGYNVPIAVAGRFDLDFDGSDDRERLIQMIERNGGRVVAYHDEDGKVHGQIDSATRYYVVGDPPSATGPDKNPEIIKAMRDLSMQAKSNSVQEIDIRKLLNWMGMHGKANPIERRDESMGEQERRASRLNDSQ